MTWLRLVIIAAAILPACASRAQTTAPRVYSDAGNIFIERNGVKTRLTASETDIDPALAPGGAYVVYTRQGRARSLRGYDAPQFCTTAPKPDELRQINIDGSGDKLILTSRRGEPEQQLCDFRMKQFSSDGRRLYFLTPGWVTSSALHVYDMRTGEEHFVIAANDVLVLNFCGGIFKDTLAVAQHRYFLFGGGYDWYWLYDPAGKKELGPLGEFSTPQDMARQAHAGWCESAR